MKATKKPKTCKSCGAKFTPYMSTQSACSVACAIELGKKTAAKAEKKKHLEAREKVKTRAEHLREAQAVFNAFIRERDKALPCISCGRHHQGQYHAGHYRSVGSCPELRFNEDNVHKQCSVCNNHLSGNAIMYRSGLLGKIGADCLAIIEGPHEPLKLSIEEIKAIKEKYKAKLKALRLESFANP